MKNRALLNTRNFLSRDTGKKHKNRYNFQFRLRLFWLIFLMIDA